jgi:FAD:protein FMN transferase
LEKAIKMQKKQLPIHKQNTRLMGNQFGLSVVLEDEKKAQNAIAAGIAEIQRIEQLLTTFKDDSQTNRINQSAGIAPVQVDKEVFDLIARAQRISAITQGAFDLSYGSIDKSLWNFDTKMTQLPSPAVALASVKLINYENIILDADHQSVFLKNKGMRIGFGGIGKGYAAEMAKKVMLGEGIENGIVNASGDLCAWGNQPDGKPWTIGIADPTTKLSAMSHFKLKNMAVATSGNYEKFAVINGIRYSHTIDPKTGLPCSGVKSVTIIAPNAELADALATPVTVMGVKVGLNLINQLQHIACVIIDDQNKTFFSKNINVK